MTTEKCIPLHILEEITNGFSPDLIIGVGGFGNVYKGDYNEKEIAVKLLHIDTVRGLDDQQFKNEVGNLLRAKHPNIVQLVGYCYETKKIYVQRNGANDFSERIYRVLCFEYLHGGSLDKHLYGQSFAPNWSTRYNIIKGVCEGLHFLHKCEPQILHLDLKPANILLDNSMEPKLADLGLSRLFTQSHTHVTERIIGSRKYMPPEFINEGKITPKNDVFSFGVVMMEIMTSSLGYSNSVEMDDIAQFKQEVVTNWTTVIEATWKYRSEEIHQVKTCIELAVRCVDSERDNRPTVADILDSLNKTETHTPKRQLADVSLCLTIGPKNTSTRLKTILAKKKKRSKVMTTEVDNITKEHQNFNSMPRESFQTIVQQVTDRETSSDVEPTLIIGRDKEKHKILSILSECNTEEMAILPIYGIGGIGKTTLAQLVFSDTQFQEHSRVWVYVSQKFDLKKIGNSIISQLTNRNSHIAEMQMLHNRLHELFSGKSTLVVLDDLWEEKQHELEKLKAMLMPRVGNKVVIVTTRDEAIARKISRTVKPYKLEILTDDMCWTIIKQKSCFEDQPDKKHLEHMGRDIAIKCAGVALAAQSLGYMLRDMTSKNQWESVRDSYIWSLSALEDPSLRNHEVLLSLLLSYSHMHEFLQLCFSYCGVFPKGCNIVKYDLIHQWLALGLTGPSSTFDSMQLCEKYITQLLGMSFIQHSKRSSSDEWHDKDATLFTMHDLVHDLARVILAEQVNDKGCHYALITDCTKPLQLSVTYPANLRALLFLYCSKLELPDDAFSLATRLRVLDLSECLIQKLPDSIGHLKQLRYLHAPRIQGWMTPNCITELSELNYLNLRGSYYISALPEFGEMKGLMHLDLSRCDKIRELPISFVELKQLVHLNLSHCYISIPEAFGGFTKLEYLNLLVDSSPFTVNRRGLLEIIGNLNKLRYLNLSRCMKSIVTSKDQTGRLLDSISTLSNLEHLDLSENEELSSIPESMGNLTKLHTLNLLGCYNLKKLPYSMVNMVSLKDLRVETSGKLDESVLSLLNIVPRAHFTVYASSHVCSSNIIFLQPTNPVKLTIDRLENVKSAEEAQSIKLREKKNIEELRFQWTIDAGRFVDDSEVLEKLVPPISVQELHITGYGSVSIPDWFMGIRLYLPNIEGIYLSDFSKCNNLPPLCQLPNLQNLSLHNMDGLEEWNTAYTNGEEGVNELFFPELKTLSIHQCAKLKLNGNTWRQLKRLKSLSLVNCGSMTSIQQWLGELTSLCELNIKHCKEIRSLPDSIQQLSNLKILDVSGCLALERWCQSKENKMKLSHIRHVRLSMKFEEIIASMKFEETIALTNKKDFGDSSAASVHGTVIDDEVLPDLYNAVMNMPGFTEEALLVALSHLMDNNAQGSAYMGMQEEQRVSWLMNFLKKNY